MLTKVRSYLHQNATHVAAQLDFQNAFGAMHRKACIEQLENHVNSQEPWFLATKDLWSRGVTISYAQEEDLFETAGEGDPLSTLVFATAMSLLMKDIIRSKAPDVVMVAYVDDTGLLGTAANITHAISEIQAETQVWSPRSKIN